MATSSAIDESSNVFSQEILSNSLSYKTPNKYSYSDSFEELNKSSNVLPQEIPSNSLSSRISSSNARNYSYSDSFETSSMKEKSKDSDIPTTLQKHKDNFSESDYEHNYVSYLINFEHSEWSDLNPTKSFKKQSDDSIEDTESNSSYFHSGILNKRTIIDASDIGSFHNSLKELDFSPRFQREITPERKQNTSSECIKEKKEKEMFIKKCRHHIEESKEERSKSFSFKYDDSLKHFLDTFMRKFSEKPLSDSTRISKCEPKNKTEIKREKFLRMPFDANPSLLAKIKMKNLMNTMNKAATVRIHSPNKCIRCNNTYSEMEATIARKRFIRCKVNDLTRKKTEAKIEDHVINMASLCL